MNRTTLVVLVILLSVFILPGLRAQVGIGTDSPTNTLHVKPANPDEDPIRIEGLNQLMQGDSALLVVDPESGIIRYLHIDSLVNYISALDDPDTDPTNEWQNAEDVALNPGIDINNDGTEEQNVRQAIIVLRENVPKGTFKSIKEARNAGLVDGDSFWADPQGVFGCSGCTITLYPGME